MLLSYETHRRLKKEISFQTKKRKKAKKKATFWAGHPVVWDGTKYRCVKVIRRPGLIGWLKRLWWQIKIEEGLS